MIEHSYTATLKELQMTTTRSLNPTDKASHRMKANELQDSRWIVGPEFLWRKEVKRSVTKATCSSHEPKSTLDERVQQFASWYHSQRAVALCMKYVKKLKARARKEPDDTAKLKVQDLERAGKLIIRATHKDGQVHKAQVAIADGCLDKNGRRSGPLRYLKQPVQKLILLMSVGE
ncbi:hypothetical protein P5673_011797 [Acropora cervicornis]|uniref:Uncharacterized protein n=1 Tax=Acropora cervicornis TaxID=6130 RepID=A0AAD9QN82_ACRCE|nr:hypothetical protein P5673_011797 [Acropora cervicornis]